MAQYPRGAFHKRYLLAERCRHEDRRHLLLLAEVQCTSRVGWHPSAVKAHAMAEAQTYQPSLYAMIHIMKMFGDLGT
jgi:hypothetical protein